MTNRLFTTRQLAVLFRPNTWRIVSSVFPPEEPCSKVPRLQHWYKFHKDIHAHREILVCLSGDAHYVFLDRIYPARSGSVFFLDAFEPHQKEFPAFYPNFVHLWIYLIHDTYMTELITFRNGRMCRAPAISRLRVMQPIFFWPDRRRFEAPESAGVPLEFKRMWLRSTIGAIVATIVQQGYEPEPSSNRFALRQSIMTAIAHHIHDTAGRGCQLDALTRLSGYSKFHFLRLFKKHTGRTAHQYVDICRQQTMDKLLAQGGNLKDVCATLGFSHPAALSRWRHKQKKETT